MTTRASTSAAVVAAILMAGRAAGADGASATLSADACATTAERAADLRDAGHLRDAVASYAICARDACPRIVREDCRRGLQAINDGGPHLIPKLHDAAGRDVLDAELLLDDVVLSADARVRGILVDPGDHLVRARRGGTIVGERTVVIAAADGLRTVDLVLEGPTRPEADKHASHALPWIVGGVGAGVLAIGGAIGTWTYLDYRSLDRDCGPNCAAARVDPVHTRGIVADVVMGVGIVTIVAAVVLSLTDRTTTKPRKVGITW